tara:strand:- start:154 stop:594 length:441 start_codon:yes stop_codon:yes gene_type:complete
MAKAYISMNAKFTITPNPDAGDLATLCKEICEDQFIELGAFEENPNFTTSFKLIPSSMVSGEIKFQNNGESVTVEMSGLAEVSVKSEYMDVFLHEDTSWRLNGLSGVFIGEFECTGLEKIEFLAKRRGKEIEDFYWKTDLKASQNA